MLTIRMHGQKQITAVGHSSVEILVEDMRWGGHFQVGNVRKVSLMATWKQCWLGRC